MWPPPKPPIPPPCPPPPPPPWACAPVARRLPASTAPAKIIVTRPVMTFSIKMRGRSATGPVRRWRVSESRANVRWSGGRHAGLSSLLNSHSFGSNTERWEALRVSPRCRRGSRDRNRFAVLHGHCSVGSGFFVSTRRIRGSSGTSEIRQQRSRFSRRHTWEIRRFTVLRLKKRTTPAGPTWEGDNAARNRPLGSHTIPRQGETAAGLLHPRIVSASRRRH